MKSSLMAKTLADYGWGELIPASTATEWKPGDICSMSGHVWLSLGMCQDGSVLLLHASPPGVRLCGTASSDGEKTDAVILAEKWMSECYPDWYAKFPKCDVNNSYLTTSDIMRWNSDTLDDAERFQAMSAEEIARKHITLIICLVLFTVLAVWTLWGNTALMTNMIRLTLSDNRLPASFSGFRIAHVSDLHNAEFGEGNTKLLRMISENSPDIIVITGDLVDSSRTDIHVAVAFAGESAKIAPTYYVTGNHEALISQQKYETLKTGLKAAGVIVLEDEAVRLERDGEEIALIGLADPDFTIKGDLFGEVPSMVTTKLKNLVGKSLYHPAFPQTGAF